MSIKIYKAYKLDKKYNLWRFIRKVRPIVENNVKEVIKNIYKMWMKNPKYHDFVREEAKKSNYLILDICTWQRLYQIDPCLDDDTKLWFKNFKGDRNENL
jgi:hypothetical protein